MKRLERCWLQAGPRSENVQMAIVIRQTIDCVQGGGHLLLCGRKQPVAAVIVSKAKCDVIGLAEDAFQVIKSSGLETEIAGYAARVAFQ